ncbi:MAG: hypothetical protein WC760_02945 [Bacteroidia bacterium]
MLEQICLGWLNLETYETVPVGKLHARFVGLIKLMEVKERRMWEKVRYLARFEFASVYDKAGVEALLAVLNKPFPWESQVESSGKRSPQEQEEFVKELKDLFPENIKWKPHGS